ncbi:hypothetical protein LTR17_000829 [Elasticomyces elasticus]|nr:hypothetical protein LTR17_000829 [Elasticomyces elasticus]
MEIDSPLELSNTDEALQQGGRTATATVVEGRSWKLSHSFWTSTSRSLRYAKRAYDIAPKQNVIKDADGSILSLGEEDVAEMPREELLETLVHLSTELDYLVEKKGIVEVTVLKAIDKLAKGGSGVDRECLWRLGYCDEVDKMI